MAKLKDLQVEKYKIMSFRRSIIFIFVLLSFSGLSSRVFSQQDTSTVSNFQTQSDTTAVATNAPAVQPSPQAGNTQFGMQTVLEMTERGGKIGYLIIVVLIVGVFFLILEFIRRNYDKKHADEIVKLKFKELAIEQIEQKVIDTAKTNSISGLLFKLVQIYRETGSSERFNDEIIKYKQGLQEKFDTFKNRMWFISDSEGALGLLGTVWGMYTTFMGGLMDPQSIIAGMGVALVTTLYGLIASLIINLFTTEIIAMFNKNLDALTEKSHEFQLKIIEEEMKRQKEELTRPIYVMPDTTRMPQPVSAPVAEKSGDGKKPVSTVTEDEGELPTKTRGKRQSSVFPQKLMILSGENQSGTVGTALKPLVVRVTDEINNPLASRQVIFKIMSGNATLSDGKTEFVCETDIQGQASSGLKLGTKVTKVVVAAQVVGKDGQWLECYFNAVANAGDAANLEYVSGNFQNAPVRSTVRQPLTVKVTDAYGNPIKDYKTAFKIESGDGRFPGNKDSLFEGLTDADGILSVAYILGDSPGINVISINAKGLNVAVEKFQLFAQPRGNSEL